MNIDSLNVSELVSLKILPKFSILNVSVIKLPCSLENWEIIFYISLYKSYRIRLKAGWKVLFK